MPVPPSFFPPPPLSGSTGAGGLSLGWHVRPALWLAGATLVGRHGRRNGGCGRLSLRPPSRIKYYLLFLAFMALGSGGAYLYLTRSGKMQIAVKPSDARVTVDGVGLHEGPPYVIERRPGIYHLAVVRDGTCPVSKT